MSNCPRGSSPQIAVSGEISPRNPFSASLAPVNRAPGSGVSVYQLRDCQQGTSDHCQWDHDTDTGGALPPLPGARFTGATLALKGLRGEISPLTAICGLLHGGSST